VSGVILHLFLTLALDGGELSASFPVCFTQGKSPQYPLDRRLHGPHCWYGHVSEEKNPCALARNWIPVSL